MVPDFNLNLVFETASFLGYWYLLQGKILYKTQLHAPGLNPFAKNDSF